MQKYKDKFLDILSWIILNPNDFILMLIMVFGITIFGGLIVYSLIIDPISTLINIGYFILTTGSVVGCIALLFGLVLFWDKLSSWAFARKMSKDKRNVSLENK
jgi:hypothetical protein